MANLSYDISNLKPQVPFNSFQAPQHVSIPSQDSVDPSDSFSSPVSHEPESEERGRGRRTSDTPASRATGARSVSRPPVEEDDGRRGRRESSSAARNRHGATGSRSRTRFEDTETDSARLGADQDDSAPLSPAGNVYSFHLPPVEESAEANKNATADNTDRRGRTSDSRPHVTGFRSPSPPKRQQ